VVLTKFHEGIDIAPTRRDAKGEPLDDVRAIEAGRVVHTSNLSNDSNYGKYVVVEHQTENAPVYTLYSHLATIDVARGQSVTRRSRLGRLGYTGAGIDQRRAHLHLEIAIMWNDGYEGWHDAHFSLPNKHGIFNGMNLMGLDVAEFYLQQRKNPALTLSQFMAKQPVFFKVHLPASPHFQLPRRYPWLVRGSAAKARSWVISFTDAGFPLAIEPSGETISHSRVIMRLSLLEGPNVSDTQRAIYMSFGSRSFEVSCPTASSRVTFAICFCFCFVCFVVFIRRRHIAVR
jgi:hypothetical protein